MSRILITGAAGYVGSVLRAGLLRSMPDLDIVALDVVVPDAPEPRVHWVRGDVTDDGWQAAVRAFDVDAVVHLAFVLREPYGRRAHQRRVNVDGTRRVRDFALATPSVRRLVHFSSVSVYADTVPRGCTAPLDEDAAAAGPVYGYARDKVDAEALFDDPAPFERQGTAAVVLRPASITGPFGRFERRRFGLISTLSAWSPFVFGGSRRFGRQFLHEDDVVAVVRRLLAFDPPAPVTRLNAAPADFLDLERLSALLEKRPLVVPPPVMRAAFFAAWHGSAGRVPTAPGAWMMLTYPHRVCGEKLTRTLDYAYRATSAQALAGLVAPAPAVSWEPPADAPVPLATGPRDLTPPPAI